MSSSDPSGDPITIGEAAGRLDLRADQLPLLISARLLTPMSDGRFSVEQIARLQRDLGLVKELLRAEEPLTPSAAARLLGIRVSALVRLEHEGLLRATSDTDATSYRRGDVEALAPHWHRHQHRLHRWRSRVDAAGSRTQRALATAMYARSSFARAVAVLAFWIQVVGDHLTGARGAGLPVDAQAAVQYERAVVHLMRTANPRITVSYCRPGCSAATDVGSELQALVRTVLGAHHFALPSDRVLALMRTDVIDVRWLDQLPDVPLLSPPAQFLPLPFIDRAALLAAYPEEAALEAMQAAHRAFSELRVDM